jgi:phosphoglycerate dehydrogenase-like enzyme
VDGVFIMRIAILDDYQNVALSLADWSPLTAKAEITVFQDHVTDLETLVRRLADFEVIMMMRERTPFPRALIERLPKLKLLCTSGMGNRSIDLPAASDRGVMVCGTDGGSMPTAELAWGLILGLARNIPREDRATREGAWQTSIGIGLNGKTLGLLGLGKLGTQMAKIGSAFGMKVIAWSQNLTEERCRAVGATKAASKDELLSKADVVSIHLVLSDRTRGLIGRRELGLMKPTAYLVNTSRGPIVDQAALIEALEKKRIAGAGVDVYDVEPLPPDHPMRRLPCSIITPHLGYVTLDNYREYFGKTVENIVAFLDGRPIRVLNPDVLATAAARI